MELSSKALTFSLICICAAFSHGASLEQFESDERIIGGMAAVPGQFPWQVEIVTTIEVDGEQELQTYCGGALISRDYVITSATCIPEIEVNITMVLGALNITNMEEPGRVQLVSDFHFVHPNFTVGETSDDIAVIHLPRAVNPSPYITPARLPPASDEGRLYIGWLGRISGWGADQDGTGKYSEILRYVDNTIVDLDLCVQKYAAGTVTDKNICSSTTGGRSPCVGDAGSPMVIHDGEGAFYQIGIFSFYDPESCIKGIPVVFTRLESHLEWIYDVTGIPPQD